MATRTWVFGVEDCKIAQLLTDPEGGTATYDTAIDVPGIKTVTISGTSETKQLRGDNRLLDQHSTLSDVTVTVTHAMVSPAVWEVLLGGTATSGSFDLAGTDTPNYFKLESRTPTGGSSDPAGDVHYTIHKCIIDGLPEMGHEEEDYRIVSFTAKALPVLATGNAWISFDSNTTETLISGS